MSKFWGTIDRLIVGDQSRSGFVSDTKDNRVAVESEASLLACVRMVSKPMLERGLRRCIVMVGTYI
ncbi:hypothetical protein M6B38_369665 [Iris pallida]|uniref:Uncharacterized protein n=1 Tax=Iris pallida TaxID=29817 RepID=A0AAX6GDV7_IRIPA|nr:hypothetical protein M6B38_369665 [Iris pallida]